MMTTHTHRDFFDALLRKLELPVRPAGRRALAAVSIYESSDGNERWNNPLACTLFWPNATPYNTFGDNQHVWRYATFADGVAATAQMYSGLHWASVRAAINSYDERGRILDAFTAAYTWADIDFRHAEFNALPTLLERLNHPLYGPK